MEGIKEGDKVRCKHGNIDRNEHEGVIGYVTGFARFSSYHGREAMVCSTPEGGCDAVHYGWFWLGDVEKV